MSGIERREILLSAGAIVASLAVPGSTQAKALLPDADQAALFGCDLLGTADPFWTEAAANLLGVRLWAVT